MRDIKETLCIVVDWRFERRECRQEYWATADECAAGRGTPRGSQLNSLPLPSPLAFAFGLRPTRLNPQWLRAVVLDRDRAGRARALLDPPM